MTKPGRTYIFIVHLTCLFTDYLLLFSGLCIASMALICFLQEFTITQIKTSTQLSNLTMLCSLPKVAFTIICLSMRLALIKGGYLILLIPKLLECCYRLGGNWTAFCVSTPNRVQTHIVSPMPMCKNSVCTGKQKRVVRMKVKCF